LEKKLVGRTPSSPGSTPTPGTPRLTITPANLLLTMQLEEQSTYSTETNTSQGWLGKATWCSSENELRVLKNYRKHTKKCEDKRLWLCIGAECAANRRRCEGMGSCL